MAKRRVGRRERPAAQVSAISRLFVNPKVGLARRCTAFGERSTVAC